MKTGMLLVAVLLLGVAACAPSPTAGPKPSAPLPESIPAPPSPTPQPGSTAIPQPTSPSPTATARPPSLWYLVRGDVKADQAWGVDVDSSGDIYLAAYEQKPGQWFTDMVIYEFSPDGDELWRTEWGGEFQEKAFIVDVAEPFVYVGGLTQHSVVLTDAEMAILALRADTGRLEWEFTWGQGVGYQEVDGLVVDGDYLYASGWTTSEGTGHDIGLLKLDLQGRKVWESVWGTDGFDTADGQMVVTGDSVYVSGRIDGTTMLTGGQAVVAQFTKETGEYIQHVTWGPSDLADGLGMTGDGVSLYVIGMNFTTGQGNQLFLLKYDLDLHREWERLWGDVTGEHTGRAAGVDSSGNVVLGENTRATGTAPTDIYLLSYSSDGELLWESRWGGADEEKVQGLVIDGGVVYLAGTIKYVEENQSDALLIKADGRTGQFPPR